MQWIVGLNSLRLFAIILIVLYHFFVDFLPGGFIAVEIFFTISGFLIVGNMANKYLQGERISYRDFIKGRFARLFPPLLLMVLIVLTLALLADADILTGFAARTLATLTFSTNIFELITGGGYEDFISPNLFRHTWFLALGMQLYLLAPLVFLLAAKQCNNRKQGIKIVVATFASLGLISMLLMVIFGGILGVIDRAYFALDTHMFSFCLGAALGASMQLATRSQSLKLPFTPVVIGVILTTITIFAYKINYANPLSFYLVLPLTGLLSLILLIGIFGIQQNRRHGRTVRLLEYLGGMSYGVYLFHYPLYLLFGYILPANTPSWVYPSLTLIISIFLSQICAQIIKSIKKLRLLQTKHGLSHKHRLALSAYVILAMVLFGGGIARLVTVGTSSNIVMQLANQSSSKQPTLESFDSDTIVKTANELITAGLSVAETAAPIYTPQVVLPKPGNTITATTEVLFIGDSVMLGAKNNIEAKIPNSYVDAKESRGIEKASGIISDLRAQGLLPQIIVIGLVTNQRTITASTYDAILNAAGPGHKFILITGYCGSTQPRDAQNAATREYADSHDNVWLADWYTLAANDWSLMYSDHIHLNFAGRETYTNLLANIIKEIQ